MGVNFAKEYEGFEREMRGLKSLYMGAGWSEEEFLAYYALRRDELNRDLAYRRHVIPIHLSNEDFEEDAQNPLLKDYLESMSTEMEDPVLHKYWWLDQIENECLIKTLLSLSDEELGLIDMFTYQNMNQEEIAQATGISQSTISRKITKLLKKMRNSL